MKCPITTCNAWASTLETRDKPDNQTYRRYLCANNHKFSTMESVVVLTSGKPAEIRKLLKGFPDGLSVNQISDIVGITVGDVRKKLAKMADAYIVSWVGEHPAALWSVADSIRDKPSNASRPRKAYETLRKLGIA